MIYGNVFEEARHFDIVYSTGLLQCLDYDSQEKLIKKATGISDRAIWIMPQREEELVGEGMTGVAGCREYLTKNVAFLLSRFYNSVRCGQWERAKIETDDDFLYFICD